jgi:hypothetical protein
MTGSAKQSRVSAAKCNFHPCTTDFAIMQWMPLEPFTVCVTRRSAPRLQSVQTSSRDKQCVGWVEPTGPVFDRPDDKLRDTHQLHFMEIMGSAGLNPSYVLMGGLFGRR